MPVTVAKPSPCKTSIFRVDVHKRLTGWGWAELFTPQGKCMGVLEHLGELMLRDQEIPMRLEAETYERAQNNEGETITFNVKSLIVKDKLKGTSFEKLATLSAGHTLSGGRGQPDPSAGRAPAH